MANIVESVESIPSDENMLDGRVLTSYELTILKEMNQQFSHVVISGKHRIMSYKPCPVDGVRMSLERIQDFYNNFAHLPKVANKNQGKAWFEWVGKKFDKNGIGYYPNQDNLPKNVFNTFRGYGCIPVAGDVSVILRHINEVLCPCDEKAATYFIQWLAHIFQKPAEKPTVAVLMKSAEGVGKGRLNDLLKMMLGANAEQVNGIYQLTGRFNAIIARRLLIIGDEVDMTTKAAFDRAKGIISERNISLELKGVDPESIPNLARFIFTGNHDQIISAGTRERRFLVLEPSAHVLDDHNYFAELSKHINIDGASAFLHYLLNLDLTGFNPFKAPATKGLIDEKLMNLPPVLQYLHSELYKPRPFNGAIRINAADLISNYYNWALDRRLEVTEPAARSVMGRALQSLKVESQGRSDRGDGKCYHLPEIKEFKLRFARHLGHESDEIF
ncbi:primase-helicase family protein [Paraglaciecola mesophila]|uniref:Primase-helicase family protein n=1 Tax=Paraglaciecola mesophila TaxID=197222 RepID=A0ABU9SPY5_9ALTE